MSKLVKEISVISGSYTNADGMKKNRYTKIGSVIETQNGEMLKLDTIPLVEGGWNGWAYMNDPKPKDEFLPRPQMQARPNLRQEPRVSLSDEDIPF
jgi:hypothetical protein